MLGQDVARTDARWVAVERIFRHGFGRRLTFQHLEPAGGHKHGARGLVQPVIGPADALNQSR
ncbi:hypothetical protein D3C80_2058370 [compost metagenome]